jgi:hypothetical protein
MAALSANSKRNFEYGGEDVYDDLPVLNAVTVYEGSAVGESVSTGHCRALVAADTFRGFATRKADNSSGAAAAINVRVRRKGAVELAITGVTGVGDLGATVYADSDNDFTLTTSSNTAIGKIVRWVSSTTCVVYFEAAQSQSI